MCRALCETDCEEDVLLGGSKKNWAWQEMKVSVFSLKTKVLCTTEMLQDHIEEAKLWHKVMKGYQWTESIFVMSRAVNFMWQGKNQTLYFKQFIRSEAINAGALKVYSDERVTRLRDNKVLGNKAVTSYLEKICYVFSHKYNQQLD